MYLHQQTNSLLVHIGLNKKVISDAINDAYFIMNLSVYRVLFLAICECMLVRNTFVA